MPTLSSRLDLIQAKSAIFHSKLKFEQLLGVADKQLIDDLGQFLPNYGAIQAIIKQNCSYEYMETNPPLEKFFYEDKFHYLEILEKLIDKTKIYYCEGHWGFRVVDVPIFLTSMSSILTSIDLIIFNSNQIIDIHLDDDDMIQIRHYTLAV